MTIQRKEKGYIDYSVVIVLSKKPPLQMFENMEIETMLGGYKTTVIIKGKNHRKRAKEVEKLLKEEK